MIIDFRLRPPTRSYKGFFSPRAVAALNARGVGCPVAPSYLKSTEGEDDATEKAALDLLDKEMDEAGIDVGVLNGRHTYATRVPCHVTDEEVAQFQSGSNGRFYGLAGINLDDPMEKILADLEKAINQLGLKGACMEPSLASTPLYPDDELLTPIYQKCLDLEIPILFMSGPFAGPDLSYTDPLHFERVASKFHKLEIVLGHGAWPYTSQVIGAAFKYVNIKVSPDVYMLVPSARDFVDAINWLPDQFIFGTAYPFGALKPVMDATNRLAIKKDAFQKYMHDNAAKLLKL